MPRLAQSVPKYRKHKASSQAFVELNGQRHYLGPHGSRTSRDEYDRLISEWLQSGRTRKPTEAESGCLLVVELISGYLNFAKSYYRKGGRLTSEYAASRAAGRTNHPYSTCTSRECRAQLDLALGDQGCAGYSITHRDGRFKACDHADHFR